MNKSNLYPLCKENFAQLSLKQQIYVLCGLDAKEKTRLLLDAHNGSELIANLPTQEIYLLALDRGLENLSELLNLATPEQWTGFIDLDCWDSDTFCPEKARLWLAVLVDGNEEAVFEILRGMNFELLTLILKSEIDILSGPEMIDDETTRMEAVNRDGGYEINYRTENGAKLYSRILAILQNGELPFFRYLMEAIRSETKMIIEESVYLQRLGRLLDMGIPEPVESKIVYSWLDPNKYKNQQPVKIVPGTFHKSPPGFVLSLGSHGGLLAKALSSGLSDEQAWELAVLTNKVLMADRVGFGDLERIKEVIHKVDANLNLALEWLAADDVHQAREFLERCYSEDLFRLGNSLTLTLKRQSRAIEQSRIFKYLDPMAQNCIVALLKNPPLFCEGLKKPTRDGTRMFESLEDIRLTEHALGKIQMQQGLFEDKLPNILLSFANLDLSHCLPSGDEDITLEILFLTSLANRVLGGNFEPSPIREENLTVLHKRICQSGFLNHRLRHETVKWLESLIPNGGEFANSCMDILDEEFCRIGVEDIDPRFIGGLIVQLNKE